MPVPTPPKQNLLKVSPPRPVTKKAVKPKGPSRDTQKLSTTIRDLTEAQKDPKNTVEVKEDTQGPVPLTASGGYRTVEEQKQHVKNNGPFKAPNHGATSAVKKTAYVPPARLTQNPFRDSLRLKDLQKELNKQHDPKNPVKRSPRPKPAHKTGDK